MNSDTSRKHAELRKQNRVSMIGLYVYTIILLLALVLVILSL